MASALRSIDRETIRNYRTYIFFLGAQIERGVIMVQMRILLFAGPFRSTGKEPWLLDDLAEEFVAQGHSVDVVVFDEAELTEKSTHDWRNIAPGIRYLNLIEKIPSKSQSKFIRYLLSIIAAHTWATRIISKNHYDLGVYTSIALFTWGLPGRLRAKGIIKKLSLIYWDFFPRYHIEIGRIRSNFAEPMIKWFEYLNMRPADVICLMSSKNVEFCKKYHPALKAEFRIIPPWSGVSKNEFLEPKFNNFTVVWGGQMILGRGLDTLLYSAKILENEGLPINFLIIGDGPQQSHFHQIYQNLGLSNTTFMGRLSRLEYRNIASRAHVGVAITLPNTSVPTFSCKLSEFAGLGLPVVISIESESDAGQLFTRYGAGIEVVAGDPISLSDAIKLIYARVLEDTKQNLEKNTSNLFTNELSATQAVKRLVA